MSGRTHYQVLMLDPTATPEVINAVYRVLAKRYHPDHNGASAAGKMAELNEAYATLSDPKKRAHYDEQLRRRGTGLASIKVTADEPPGSPASPRRPAATEPAGDSPGSDSTASPSDRASSAGLPEFGEAGRPPSFLPRRGSTITFGRYRGWTVSQVALYDRDYVVWLSRSMAGRTYHAEAKQALERSASR